MSVKRLPGLLALFVVRLLAIMGRGQGASESEKNNLEINTEEA